MRTRAARNRSLLCGVMALVARHVPLLLLTVLAFAPGRAVAQDSKPATSDLQGEWAGVLNLGQAQLRVTFHLRKSDSGYTGTLDVPDQGSSGIPCDKIQFKNGQLTIHVNRLAGAYVGKMNADGTTIVGIWAQGGQRAQLSLQRSSHATQAIPLTFAIVMVLLSAFFLRLACGLCAGTLPSWRRALISTFVVSILAYLTFDFFAYLIMRSMDGVKIQVPPWYGFKYWFREPIQLKWFIISQVGVLRYLPIIFALCAAGVLQVIVLQAEVKFRVGLMIVLLQWGVTMLAGYIFLLLFGVAVDTTGWTMPGPVAHAPTAEDRKKPSKNKPAKTDPKVEPAAPESASDSLQVFKSDAKETFERAWTNLKGYADTYLEELKVQLAPLTNHLPESVQNFLNDGGWWAIIAVVGFIALLWLRSIVRRLKRAMKPRKKKKKRSRKVQADLREKLSEIGHAYTEEGTHQLTVKGVPARLRLVILSLGARSSDRLNEEMVDRVLDWIKPGLAEATATDYPRVRLWPPCYSVDGFASQFANFVSIPDPRGAKSHWVLLSGQVKMGQVIVNVGLAAYTDTPTAMRNIKIKREDWLGVVGVQATSEVAQAR